LKHGAIVAIAASRQNGTTGHYARNGCNFDDEIAAIFGIVHVGN
jgi:hypothetical protein